MKPLLFREEASLGQYMKRVSLALLGIVFFVVMGITLEKQTGIPFNTFYRIGCASICLFFIFKLRSDYPQERWPWISLWIAFVVNIGIFFTPLVDRPASRGELMLFALPDAIIVLGVRLATFSANDDHRRAQRQMLILGLIVAVVFCTILYFLIRLPGAH